MRSPDPIFRNTRSANGGVPRGVSPNGSIQNDSGLPQGPPGASGAS